MSKGEETENYNERWVAEFQAKSQLYERFCLKLQSLLEDILSSEAVGYHVIESRAKSVASFAEKVHREGKSYSDPLREITDLAGLRVILYYTEDVERVSQIVDREFLVDTLRSVDKRTVLAPDQFGYLSVHKIVSLSEARTHLPEWGGLAELVAEIQIRTVLQHSWATISHALQYKREADIPLKSRRKLIRLSGLLELADEEFASLREQQSTLRKAIAEKVSEGDLNLSVDVLSVQEFVKKSEVIRELERLATELGMSVEEDDSDDMSKIAQVCQMAGIGSISALEQTLKRVERRAKAFLQKFLSLEQTRGLAAGVIGVSRAHLTAMVLLGMQGAEISSAWITGELSWSSEYVDMILEAGQKLRE